MLVAVPVSVWRIAPSVHVYLGITRQVVQAFVVHALSITIAVEWTALPNPVEQILKPIYRQVHQISHNVRASQGTIPFKTLVQAVLLDTGVMEPKYCPFHAWMAPPQ